MVQLKTLTGKQAGTESVVRRFPFRVGRSSESHLVLEDPGVWEKHFELRRDNAVVLHAAPNALVSINGTTVREAALRNGDLIEIGSAKIQFSLAPARHRSLRPREFLTWSIFVLVALSQIALVYWLLR
jgi:pSer/pThr/pTyr-binding forkhead associated (FHA) protein